MSEKKTLPKIEQLIRDAFNNQFNKHLLDDGVEYDNANFFDWIKDAKTFEEARNIIIAKAKKNPAEIRPFVEAFILNRRKNGENWDKNSFDFTKIDERPYDAESLSLDSDGQNGADLFSRANKIAEMLGYDVDAKGLESLISDFVGDESNPYEAKEKIRKGLKGFLRKKYANGEDALNFIRNLDYTPVATQDFILNDMTDILSRAKYVSDAEKFKNKHKILDFSAGFGFPFIKEKYDKGKKSNYVDLGADLLQYVPGVGIAAKASKAKEGIDNATKIYGKTLGNASAASGIGALIGFGHDIADSALTKHVFADTPSFQDIRTGDVEAAIDNWPEAVKNFAAGLPVALVLGNTGGRRLDPFSSAIRGLGNGLEALMGKGKRLKQIAANSELIKNSKDALKKLLSDNNNTKRTYKGAVKEIDKQLKMLRSQQAAIEGQKKLNSYEKAALRSTDEFMEDLVNKKRNINKSISEINEKSQSALDAFNQQKINLEKKNKILEDKNKRIGNALALVGNTYLYKDAANTKSKNKKNSRSLASWLFD